MKIVFQSILFLAVCFGTLGILSENSFAADPTTEAECKALTPNPGRCAEKPIFGSTVCNANEKIIGGCEKTGVNDRVCCVPQGSTNDATCSSLNCNGTKGVCQQLSCGDGLKQSGICDTSIGISQVCCIPKDCTPATTSTPASPGSSAALEYTPLENLPGFENESGDFPTYFGNLYRLALWIVAFSALFMLTVGGFLYLSSAGNTHLLGAAKKTIFGALIGLGLALVSWLLLDTINSDLTNLKLSGLSSTGGTSSGNGGTSGGGNTPEEYRGKGSGCSGAETQGGSHCEDASQDLSDLLKCMVDKLGSKKMQISSISDDSNGQSIFTRCRDNYAKPPCEHGENSCHYGGKAKKDKSCAADISGRYMGNPGAASAGEVKDAATKCKAGYVLDEGDHVHVSVNGCSCN